MMELSLGFAHKILILFNKNAYAVCSIIAKWAFSMRILDFFRVFCTVVFVFNRIKGL